MCENSIKAIFPDRLILVPSKNPRWKNPTETIEDRLNMIKLILNDYSLDFEIEDCEIKSRKDVDYTIETIEFLKEKYKNGEFFMLIGADQVNKFHLWRNGILIRLKNLTSVRTCWFESSLKSFLVFVSNLFLEHSEMGALFLS